MSQANIDRPLDDIISDSQGRRRGGRRRSSRSPNNAVGGSDRSRSRDHYRNDGERRGRGSRGRGRGRVSRGGNRGQTRPAPTNDQRVLKVGTDTDVKRAAGAVCHISRTGEPPAILATGPLSVNQCIKALAIARINLNEENIDFMCFPEFSSLNSVGGNPSAGFSFDIKLQKVAFRACEKDPQDTDIKVSQDSNPGSVAGAIANRIRQHQRVTVLAIGPSCVSIAVKALTLTRNYLVENKLDIGFKPTFTAIEFPNREPGTGVRFFTFASEI